MSAVIFFGSLYVFITPGFSLYTITNESYAWMDSLDACNKINMSLASQQRIHNATSLSPSETEAYWIQELEIIKMFPRDATISPYNVSYSITINNNNLQYQCTYETLRTECGAASNSSNNLIKLGSFSTIIGQLTENLTYRIGVVNYTSLLNETNPTYLIRCVLYYEGKIYSEECSQRRRAICVEDEIQSYAVSMLNGSIPGYSQQPSSTTDLETKTTTLYIIIGASISAVVVLGLVILLCTACLCRRQTFDAKQSHISVNTQIRSDKTDRLEACSKDVYSTNRAEISQNHSFCQVKSDIVQYSTPEDTVKFAVTKETDECAICTKLEPNIYINVSKTNMRTSCDANIYQPMNVVVDTTVYDTTNIQNEKVIILDPTYDHFTSQSNART